MLNMQLMIFLLVIIGFCIRKKGIVGTEGRKNMVDLCLFCHTSVLILFIHFFMEWDWGMMVSCAIVLFLSIGYNVVSIVTSFVCYRKEPHYRQKTLRYGTIVSNGGFLGNPIIEGDLRKQRTFLYIYFYDPCPDCDVDDWNVCVYERKRAGRKSRETQPVSKSDDQSLHCGGLYRGNSDGERDQPSDFSGKYYFGDQQLQYTAQHDAGRDDACRNESEGTFDQVRCILHICPADCCARDCVWIDGTASDRSASSGNHSDHCGDADTDYSSTSVRKTWRR